MAENKYAYLFMKRITISQQIKRSLMILKINQPELRLKCNLQKVPFNKGKSSFNSK